jgi:hypothetical protein
MKLLPTMSRSALLLQCSWPFSKPDTPGLPFDPSDGFSRELPDPEPAGEAASYGLDFHAAMDGRKTRAGKKLPKGVLGHAKEAREVLTRWLKREGWADGVVYREFSLALRFSGPYKGDGRFAKQVPAPTEDTHEYLGQERDEIRGTADLVVRNSGRILIVDYKTGKDEANEYPYPSRLPQLRTLGVAAAHLWRDFSDLGIPSRPTLQLAVLHAPPDGTPIVYADPPCALFPHAMAMNHAVGRIGDGTLRPGPECRYCPARAICPTRGASLLDTADQLFGGLAIRQSQALLQGNDQNEPGSIEPWDAKLGRLYELTQLAEKTAKEIRVRLAEERRKGHLPVLPDGRVLDFVKRTYRNLSMSGMERQIGKKAAEREVKRLEKLGAIEVVTREELRPTHD